METGVSETRLLGAASNRTFERRRRERRHEPKRLGRAAVDHSSLEGWFVDRSAKSTAVLVDSTNENRSSSVAASTISSMDSKTTAPSDSSSRGSRSWRSGFGRSSGVRRTDRIPPTRRLQRRTQRVRQSGRSPSRAPRFARRYSRGCSSSVRRPATVGPSSDSARDLLPIWRIESAMRESRSKSRTESRDARTVPVAEFRGRPPHLPNA